VLFKQAHLLFKNLFFLIPNVRAVG